MTYTGNFQVGNFPFFYCVTGFRRLMMVKVNGSELDIAGFSVKEYLDSTSYNPARVAVEINGDIVFKSQYDTVLLKDDDSMEVVSFVGGG